MANKVVHLPVLNGLGQTLRKDNDESRDSDPHGGDGAPRNKSSKHIDLPDRPASEQALRRLADAVTRDHRGHVAGVVGLRRQARLGLSWR